MKILFLAPQPFFQERGTPIAVRLALTVLAERYRHRMNGESPIDIDLLTYHEGDDIEIEGVKLHRIRVPRILSSYLKGVSPGVSFKKLLCDLFFLFEAMKLVWKQRSDQYLLVHAVEEGVFVALLIKLFFRIPYIYDMDSSMAMQVTEKWPITKLIYPLLGLFEKMAVKFSMAVAPVCDALGVIAERHGAKETVVLRDVSLINPDLVPGDINLRNEANIEADCLLGLYVGNLEHYQGIDLLLNSVKLAIGRGARFKVAIIGGKDEDCAKYRRIVKDLEIDDYTRILGARPVSNLGDYILQADILISPRIKGNNTPMKIYSYLHSGKAIIATNLPTHTQVLNHGTAILAEPEPLSFSEALVKVCVDPVLRKSLGANARALAEEKYTYPTFARELNHLYDQVGLKLPAALSHQEF